VGMLESGAPGEAEEYGLDISRGTVEDRGVLCRLVAHGVGWIAVEEEIWIVEAPSAGLPGFLSGSMSGPSLGTDVWRLKC
jgi:hypothetical protein